MPDLRKHGSLRIGAQREGWAEARVAPDERT